MNSYFARKLKETRENEKLTQEDLGKILGVSKSAVSAYEKGTREPNVSALAILSEFFKMSADDLLGISKYEPANEIEMIIKFLSYYNELNLQGKMLVLKSTETLAKKDKFRSHPKPS